MVIRPWLVLALFCLGKKGIFSKFAILRMIQKEGGKSYGREYGQVEL